MARRPWGKDDHGPGGEPSWLGGTERDRASSGSSDAGSGASPGQPPRPDSDFGTAASAPVQGDPGPAPVQGPQFGRASGAEQQAGDDEQWSSSFGSDGGTGSGRQPRSLSRQLPGLLITVIAVCIIAFSAYRTGTGMGMIVLVVLIPMLLRIVRIIRQSLSGSTERR